jgi:hypothetical protein
MITTRIAPFIGILTLLVAGLGCWLTARPTAKRDTGSPVRLAAAPTRESTRSEAPAGVLDHSWKDAFATAQDGDLAEARDRFARLHREASALPDHGGPLPGSGVQVFRSSGVQDPGTAGSAELGEEHAVTVRGEVLPTVEEDAAYQHAVLTAAIAAGRGAGKAESGASSQRGGASLPPGSSTLHVPPSTLDAPRPTLHEAEREFIHFMRDYPESPLVHAAVRRIGMLHGGDIPKSAEAVWRQAVRIAQAREKARQRARSMCGPEVLAEILRRYSPRSAQRPPRDFTTEGTEREPRGSKERGMGSGQSSAVRGKAAAGVEAPSPPALGGQGGNSREALAKELGTDERGTTLKVLAAALRRRGFTARGLRLTWPALWRLSMGATPPPNPPSSPRTVTPTLPYSHTPKLLRQQATPPQTLIARLEPAHLVLVERATPVKVIVWDPDGAGLNRPAVKEYNVAQWQAAWSGVILAVH